ncbi:hypothetical protein [Deinococcus altitudinis]|uniref:hypothetical protein n=1 Tax=Deinococcus altitudinis TaxID=468914 RepID=UPI003891D095
MKNLTIMVGIFALGLSACSQNGVNIGQGFSMDANVTGANVSVAVVEVKDKTSGALKGYRSTYTLTNPGIVFNALPQSVGLNIQTVTVEVLDNAGIRYDGDLGRYQRSVSLPVKSGFTCSTADTTVENCSPSNKLPANVATTFTNTDVRLVTDEIASQIASDCQSSVCPTLKLKVTFAGVDSAGRAQAIIVAGASLGASVASRTTVTE